MGRGGEGARKTDGDRIGRHDWIGWLDCFCTKISMNISKAIFPSGEHALYPCMYVKNKLLTKKTNWKKIDNSQVYGGRRWGVTRGEGGEYSKGEEIKVSKEKRGGSRDMKIAYDEKWWNRYIMILIGYLDLICLALLKGIKYLIMYFLT